MTKSAPVVNQVNTKCQISESEAKYKLLYETSAATAKTITSTSGTGNVDLCTALVPKYIADMPVDPTTGSKAPAGSVCTDSGATYSTGYTVVKSATNNRVTVTATPEIATSISVTR